MGRKERRELERKVKHLAKTKPWELNAFIRDTYGRDIVDARTKNEDILAPGDNVTLDVKKIVEDPDFGELDQEYKDWVYANANQVFTLRSEIRRKGPFDLVSFNEDEEEPRKWFYLGYVKKAKSDE